MTYLLHSNIMNDEPFGTILGKTKNNVIAYSCYKGDIDYNNLNYSSNNLTGIKWQCVEFARRYLIESHNITFNQVNNAYNIFDLPEFITTNNKSVPIYKYINGSNKYPSIGDLLIWNHTVCNKKTGHVAIITKVSKNNVYVAEQNWQFQKWKGNYSRKIPLSFYDNKLNILDQHIIGWINYNQ